MDQVINYVRRIVPATETEFLIPSQWWLSGAAIDLYFSTNQIYPSGAFTDYLSISRASSGYAKNASTLTQFGNNTLRITDLGVLVEDARTNELLYSNDFTQWNTLAATPVQDVTGPDGISNSGWTLHQNAGNQVVIAFQSVSVAAGSAVSCFVKKGNGLSYAYLATENANGYKFSCFNLDTGTVATINVTLAGTPDITHSNANIEAYGNGWYRISVISSGATSTSTQVGFANADAVRTAPNGTDTGLAFGVQHELGSFPSSYIPTTTTSATRAADVITHIGNLATDIAAATASIIAQTNNGESTSFAANVVDSNGTNLLGFDATNHGLTSITATLATANTANRTSTADKVGTAWDGTGRSLVLNNGTVATDATAQTPNATQHLGSTGAANFIFSYVGRLTVWTTKLADSTLQGFTA